MGSSYSGAAVRYFEEETNASQTRGECDVVIDNSFDLISDLEAMGASDIHWWITPSFEDHHPLWILVRCKRRDQK